MKKKRSSKQALGLPVSQLSTWLNEKGIVAFAAAVEKTVVDMPRINSRWHVESICRSSEKPAAFEARDFGKALVMQLDQFAEKIRAYGPIAESQERCRLLLDLADWAASTSGYGNLFIAARCQDLAAVEIGRLLADEDCSLATGQKLLGRIDAPWNEPKVRAEILNHEAGMNLFRTGLASITQQDLDLSWKLGVLCQLEHANPQLKTARRGIPPKGLEPWHELAAPLNTGLKSQAALEQNAAFFHDDPYAAGKTLAQTWDLKHHFQLVVGLRPRSSRDLAALAAFRKAVRRFPQKSSHRKHPFSSEGEAAFDEAWRRHATSANHTVYSRAWAAYDQIRCRQFLDGESRRNIAGAPRIR